MQPHTCFELKASSIQNLMVTLSESFMLTMVVYIDYDKVQCYIRKMANLLMYLIHLLALTVLFWPDVHRVWHVMVCEHLVWSSQSHVMCDRPSRCSLKCSLGKFLGQFLNIRPEFWASWTQTTSTHYSGNNIKKMDKFSEIFFCDSFGGLFTECCDAWCRLTSVQFTGRCDAWLNIRSK